MINRHGRPNLPSRLVPVVGVLAGLVLLVSSLFQLSPVLHPWWQASAFSSGASVYSSNPQGLEAAGTAEDEYVVDASAAAAPAREPLLARSSARSKGTAEGTSLRGRPKSSQPPTDPQVAAPASLAIPSIGVDTRLIRLGLNPDKSLQVPRNYSLAGWYTKGAAPGERGPAVIAGHYDSVDGPAVFYGLSQLRPGQSVQVRRADGSVAKFSVDRVERFSKGRFPTDEVYGWVARPELRLITCGGSFDYSTRHYRDNIVVFAHML